MNCIIGLGKESSSAKSKSFISYAKSKGYLDEMIYSIEMAPVTASAASKFSHRMLK